MTFGACERGWTISRITATIRMIQNQRITRSIALPHLVDETLGDPDRQEGEQDMDNGAVHIPADAPGHHGDGCQDAPLYDTHSHHLFGLRETEGGPQVCDK